ncbi:hypothetical protein [Microlunatus sp. GCM10028923]|uniref:hypothetical protein n=1 Tax=Microlunatus sp. GCM10028923 TaxID=3273400 RepID=UPI0036172944
MTGARQTINVRTWSKTVPPYGFRPGDLDLYVLKEHDDILRALGRERSPDRSGRLGVFLGLICLVALVGGVSTFGGTILSTAGGVTRSVGEAGPLDDDLGIPITAGCFVVVLAGVIGIGYRWWSSHRHSTGLEIGYLIAAVGCGGIALWQLGTDRGVPGFAPASLPVWLTVAAAAVLLAAVLLFSRGRRVPVPRHFRAIGPPDPDRAAGLVAGLEPRVREKLLDERRRAIGRLRDRDLLDDAAAADLESTPLGTSPLRAEPR